MFSNFFVKKANRILKLRRNTCYVVTKKNCRMLRMYIHTCAYCYHSNVSLCMIIHTSENNDAMKKLSRMIQEI